MYPHSTALVLYVGSPVPVTRRLAPVPFWPCPPEMRNPPLMVLAAVVDTEATLRAEPLERVGCLAFIAVATSPIPVKVMLLVALSVDAATDCTFNALLVVRAFCFVAISADRSVPFTYNGPASIMLDPITAEPAISIDGAVTAQENTALPAEIPSRSTPFESARLNVAVAGFMRAQVNSLNANELELDKTACFPLSASVKPVTSAMATGPVDACA